MERYVVSDGEGSYWSASRQPNEPKGWVELSTATHYTSLDGAALSNRTLRGRIERIEIATTNLSDDELAEVERVNQVFDEMDREDAELNPEYKP